MYLQEQAKGPSGMYTRVRHGVCAVALGPLSCVSAQHALMPASATGEPCSGLTCGCSGLRWRRATW